MAPAESETPSGPEWEYELRMPDGRLAGLHHVYSLQAMLYQGKLDQGCMIRRPAPGPAWPDQEGRAGEWQEPWTLPSLRSVYELLGLETSKPEGEHRIAGWQRSAEAEEEEEHSQPSVTQATPPVQPAVEADRSKLVPLIIGTVLLLLVLLVVGLVLAG